MVGLCTIAVSRPSAEGACAGIAELVTPIASQVQQLSATLMSSGQAVLPSHVGLLCGALGALCVAVNAALIEFAAAETRAFLWELTWTSCAAAQSAAVSLGQRGCVHEGRQVEDALCSVLGPALSEADSTTQLAALRHLQRLASTNAAAAVLDVLEAQLPHLGHSTMAAGSTFGGYSDQPAWVAVARATILQCFQQVESTAREDPELHAQALRVAAVCASYCPKVLAGPDVAAQQLLEFCLLLGVNAMVASQHRGLCEDAVALVRVVFRAADVGNSSGTAAGQLAASLGKMLGLVAMPSPPDCPHQWGPRLVDACVGAASGGMPSWMMSPLSAALHEAWGIVGTPTFCWWLTAALDNGSGAPSGWRDMSPPSKRLEALLGPQAVGRGTKAERLLPLKEFKKRLKVLSGGKKKGTCGQPPPRSSSSSR